MSTSAEEFEVYSDASGVEGEPMSRQDSVFSQCSEAESYAGYSEDETMIAGDMDAAIGEEEDEAAEVLTPSDLLERQIRGIEEVNSVFQIPAGTARILLAHFKWDKERLFERYYDGDRDKLFAEANCVNPATVKEQSEEDGPKADICCDICFTDFPANQFRELPCGHAFCEECWVGYLKEQIMEQGSAAITCPGFDCPILADEYTVTQLLALEPQVLKRYHYLAAKDFVQGNRHIRWCPAAGCENAVRSQNLAAHAVTCHCGHTFCFKCTEAAHSPVKCEMLGGWLKKCADDSETSNWIAANTKECPKCNATIEKAGGCNHMSCRNSACRYEFCWVCLGPWEPHGSSWYNCNRFSEQDSVQARDAQFKSRDSLQRYLFYFNRYANHDQSRKLEGKLWKLVERKQKEMQEASLSWIEVQFLSNAVKVLSECRATLMYTYVFAYYLQKNNQAHIFEQNQKDLEMATERLSEYLEREASGSSLVEMRQKVQDLSKYLDQRRKVLLDHVFEGYDQNLWDYAPDSMRAIMAAAS